MTRASTGPFNSVSTAARAHIAGQRMHAAASADSARNRWRFCVADKDIVTNVSSARGPGELGQLIRLTFIC